MSEHLAVIGTAGRGADAKKLSPGLYDRMYQHLIETIQAWKVRSAVSGLAPYGDHLAIRAYLDGHLESLQLYSPCHWTGRRFIPDASVQFNPGRTLNQYHEAFCRTVGIDSFEQIRSALTKGAQVQVRAGFHPRNQLVAEAAAMMCAFTFGDGPTVRDFSPGTLGFTNSASAGLKDGGTAFTWAAAKTCQIKRHVSLTSL